MKYEIFFSDFADNLVKMINEKITEGWNLCGGPFQFKSKVCQVMTFEEDGKKTDGNGKTYMSFWEAKDVIMESEGKHISRKKWEDTKISLACYDQNIIAIYCDLKFKWDFYMDDELFSKENLESNDWYVFE